MKELVRASTITKHILDIGVTFIVVKLLVSAAGVKKQLTKAIFKDKAIQFRINTLGLAEVLEAFSSNVCYFMGSSKTKVYLKDGPKVTALLDINVEINVMTTELMENINLAMRQGHKLELVSYTRYSQPFCGFCKNLEIANRGLKTRYPIFVVEAGDHNLILG